MTQVTLSLKEIQEPFSMIYMEKKTTTENPKYPVSTCIILCRVYPSIKHYLYLELVWTEISDCQHAAHKAGQYLSWTLYKINHTTILHNQWPENLLCCPMLPKDRYTH